MANSKSLDNLNVYDWIILILSMIGGVYQILICISLLKLFYRSKNTIKYDTGILSLATIILYTGNTIYFVVFFIIERINDVVLDADNISGWIFEQIWEIPWNCAQIICYILFFKRLEYAFHNHPQYFVSKCTRYYIYGSIMIYCLVSLMVIPLVFESVWDIKFEITRLISIVYVMCSIILNLNIPVSILYTFIKKLGKVAKSLRNAYLMNSNSTYGSSISIELSLSKKHKRVRKYSNGSPRALIKNKNTTTKQILTLLDLMSKLLILYGLMIISTQMVMIVKFLWSISILEFEKYFMVIVYGLYISKNIDCVIGSTCIYFSFHGYEYRYMKCCKYPHLCIRNKCTKRSVNVTFDSIFDKLST